jgi:hypothetical protein
VLETANNKAMIHKVMGLVENMQLVTNKHEILVFIFVWVTSEFLAQIRQGE